MHLRLRRGNLWVRVKLQNHLNAANLIAAVPAAWSITKQAHCQEGHKQARSQVIRFGGQSTTLGGHYFCCIVCFKQIILIIFSD